MIGMIASNLLRGDLHIVTPRELDGHLNDWQIIDVRSPEDFRKEHVPSALNVPIDTLRESLAGIDKKRPVVVYSRVGYHGYLAYRTLMQLGYQVVNLDGGLKLLIEGGSGIGLVSTSSD
jgi:rhodanese-related sulfurtransferase